jgi:hypothetical protein
MDNARDLERYSSIGADIRQVESVIAELERHRRVLSAHVTELRDLLETMEAVTRMVRAVARCSATSTIGGGKRLPDVLLPIVQSHQLALAVRSLAISVPLTRGKIAAHLRSRKAAPRRRRREHASA